MRRFIAHVGAPKTGTTAFQVFVASNRDALLRHGYLTPAYPPRGNHRLLAEALSLSILRAEHQRERDAFTAAAAAHPRADLLISSESLVGPEALARVDALARSAATMADRRVVLLVVRDPIAQYNSGFAQQRKAMRNTARGFADFLAHAMAQGRADWRRKIGVYEDAGFAPVVLPYDTAMKRRGAARAMLEAPLFGGLAARLDWPTAAMNNPSMGAIGLIIMDLILEAAIDGSEEAETRAPPPLRERVRDVAAHTFDDAPFNGFTAAQREMLLSHYADSNAWVAARWFGRAWDEVLPPQPVAPVSPRTLDDLPATLATQVRAVADRLTAEARAKGWLGRAIRSRPGDDPPAP